MRPSSGCRRRAAVEVVTAAVVLAPARRSISRRSATYCRGSLAAYKVPRQIVAVDELPRSLIGKVLRRQVREQLLRDHA